MVKSLYADVDCPITYTLIALSYRGFWTSRGRPSQPGIELDARAALDWIAAQYGRASGGVRLVLWGQRIGAGVATTAAARYEHAEWPSNSARPRKGRPPIHSLILETPFISLRQMLITLYPQRWLPYRHLGPFLRNHWDSEAALHRLSVADRAPMPAITIVQAGNDELVPLTHGIRLETLSKKLGFPVKRTVVSNALHTEVLTRSEGRRIIVESLKDVGRDA